LLYITLRTRPNIAFSVIKLARFATNPSNYHMTLIKRVLRYLKATKNYGIIYTNNSTNFISGYCDADYAGDNSSAKSTLGYIFILTGGPIS